MPDGVDTVMGAGPGFPGGVVASMRLALMIVNSAMAPSIVTAWASMNPLPTMLTRVPPAAGPDAGVTEVAFGPSRT